MLPPTDRDPHRADPVPRRLSHHPSFRCLEACNSTSDLAVISSRTRLHSAKDHSAAVTVGAPEYQCSTGKIQATISGNLRQDISAANVARQLASLDEPKFLLVPASTLTALRADRRGPPAPLGEGGGML